jgi:ferredoxin-NADP reductase
LNDMSPTVENFLSETLLEVRVNAIRYAARDTRLYEFGRADGLPLPPTTPGCHIDLHLDNGLVRQYSLINTSEIPSCYVLGIKRDAAGAGGSRYIHEHLNVGMSVKISQPRNHFALAGDVAHSVLIAGGIGITPIWAMAQHLTAIGAVWEMHYATRSRADTVFYDQLMKLPNVHLHFSDENAGNPLDIAAIAAEAPATAHLYCCGPVRMLESFEAATAGRPQAHVHVEYFSARQEAATEGDFTLELARSGKTILVPPGRTILELVREAGIEVPSSCEQGVCGACETKIISGQADHRDAILTEAERHENQTLMICCSGARSERLVLDL